MAAPTFHLAIETSSRRGSITLGTDAAALDTLELDQPRRHNVELAAGIDRLFRKRNAGPDRLGEIYLSIGPGSFTGLRIAVATAKMLAFTLKTPVVAVPTLDVVVQNAPPEHEYVAVCLDVKPDSMYTGIYRRADDGWQQTGEPDHLTADQLLQTAPRPLALLGNRLPDHPWPGDVQPLDAQLAVPRSEQVWRLGSALARQNNFADPMTLTPLYARPPEAEQLWQKRQLQQKK